MIYDKKLTFCHHSTKEERRAVFPQWIQKKALHTLFYLLVLADRDPELAPFLLPVRLRG